MAFGRSGRSKQESSPEGAAGEDAWSATETYLDRGCELVGELRFAENVRIDGRVEGSIEAAKTVVISEDAEIEADIRAESLEVYGAVKGDIHVSRSTTLHKSARVTGEIQTAGIVVEEGARFKGCIVIGGEEPTVTAAKPAEGMSTQAPSGLPTPASDEAAA